MLPPRQARVFARLARWRLMISLTFLVTITIKIKIQVEKKSCYNVHFHFFSTLCSNTVAWQVAGKIAQCNDRALNLTKLKPNREKSSSWRNSPGEDKRCWVLIIYPNIPEIPGGNVNGERFYRLTKWKSSTENGELESLSWNSSRNGQTQFSVLV